MPKTWTDAQRAKAAARCRAHRPWFKSTGPRTAAGKKISARNAYKHGRYSRDITALRHWLCQMARASKILRTAHTRLYHTSRFRTPQKTRNELSSSFLTLVAKGHHPPPDEYLRYKFQREIRQAMQYHFKYLNQDPKY